MGRMAGKVGDNGFFVIDSRFTNIQIVASCPQLYFLNADVKFLQLIGGELDCWPGVRICEQPAHT